MNNKLTFDDIDAYLAQYKWKTGEGLKRNAEAVQWLKDFVKSTRVKLTPFAAIAILKKMRDVDPKVWVALEVYEQTQEWLLTKEIATVWDLDRYVESIKIMPKDLISSYRYKEIKSAWDMGAINYLSELCFESNCNLIEALEMMAINSIDDLKPQQPTTTTQILLNMDPETRWSYWISAADIVKSVKEFRGLKVV